MKARIAQLLILAGFLISIGAVADTRLEVRLDHASAMVGEPRKLVVELVTTSWFRRVEALPEIAVDGAVVLMPNGFASNYTERRQGEIYAVQRREVQLIPQRDGELLIPSMEVRVWVAPEKGSVESGMSAAPLVLRSAPVTLAVQPVPGTSAEQRIPVARGLRMVEQYSDTGSVLHPGDGLTRRVRISVNGLPGMFIPELRMPPLSGVRSYRDRAQVQDRANRGEQEGSREETLTHVFEHEGRVELPALSMTWWNLDENRLEVTRLPSRTIEIQPFPGEQSSVLVAYWSLAIASGLVLGLSVVMIGWRYRRQRYGNREAVLFGTLMKSCRTGTPQGILAAFYAWQDVRTQSPNQLKPVSNSAPRLGRWLNLLLQRVYARPGSYEASGDEMPGRWRVELRRCACRLRKREAVSKGGLAAHVSLNPSESQPHE